MSAPKKGWEEFIKLCAEIQSPKELREFLDLFCTIEEKETFASRFLIIQALIKGEQTQREIAESSKVSIAQITRGSNALKIISSKLRELLKTKLT